MLHLVIQLLELLSFDVAFWLFRCLNFLGFDVTFGYSDA